MTNRNSSRSAWTVRLLCSTALGLVLANLACGNPLDGTVAAGIATIVKTNPQTLTINQTTQKAVINWRSFSIGQGETTNFIQPSASAITLNRVTSVDPSTIMGNLTANGQVWLINPNGIAFGKTARVDVAGLLATTIDIADRDFMSGNYRFSALGKPSAMVTNAGQITVRNAGLAALVAPGVENSGLIQANLGQIQLSSATAFTVDLYGDGLFNFTLNKQVTQAIKKPDGTKPTAAVTNSGQLIANGGKILLTANAARSVVDHAINMNGYVQATSASVSASGEITLDGSAEGSVQVAGTVDASGKGAGQTGGTVHVTGQDVQLTPTATIDASGDAGGGTALVGGEIHGGGTLRHASTTAVAQGASIKADAIKTGSGGQVVVWSDDQTSYQGAISARGGTDGGNGGTAEVSSHGQLMFDGTVDLASAIGTNGSLLLDPKDITIGSTGSWVVSLAALTQALANSDVIITTNDSGIDSGDITVAQSFAWNGSTSLTLSANRNIVFQNAAITHSGSGNLSLHADSQGTGTGTVLFNGGTGVYWNGSSGVVALFYNPASGYSNPTSFSQYVSGAGSNFAAYMLVNSKSQLQSIASNLSGSYALGRDISGGSFVPIGSAANPFNGIFNGDGHTVANLIINTSLPDAGFFGYIGASGKISNVGLTSLSLTGTSTRGDQYVGGLAGTNEGAIFNSYVTGNVQDTIYAYGVGGLVGYNYGTIDLSYSAATVIGHESDVGGLVGWNGLFRTNGLGWTKAGSIARSYATGSVTDVGTWGESAGGLVGRNDGYACTTNNRCSGTVVYVGSIKVMRATIDQSFATGSVKGTDSDDIGGLVGTNFGAVTNSYATGSTSDSGTGTYVGGLVGTMHDMDSVNGTTALISQSYATGRVTDTAWTKWEDYTGTLAQVRIQGGGLAGYYAGSSGSQSATVVSSYWDTQTTGRSSGSGNGVSIGSGQTTASLKGSLPSGFDSSIWYARSGSYPDLRWRLTTTNTTPTTIQPALSNILTTILTQTTSPPSASLDTTVAGSTPALSATTSNLTIPIAEVAGILLGLTKTALENQGALNNGALAELRNELQPIAGSASTGASALSVALGTTAQLIQYGTFIADLNKAIATKDQKDWDKVTEDSLKLGGDKTLEVLLGGTPAAFIAKVAWNAGIDIIAGTVIPAYDSATLQLQMLGAELAGRKP